MSPHTQRALNVSVIAVAAAGIFWSIYANSHWLEKASADKKTARERCYGIVRAAKNDCGTAQHSCANQASKDNQPSEWIMLPKGVCPRIAGGVSD